MMITTPRLAIFPLSYHQLLYYIKENNQLEDYLGLEHSGRVISEEMKDMLAHFTLPKMKFATHENYLFYTIWIVINKIANTIVAEIGFKGEPDENGKVEIGYGTMPDERGKGYMTETVEVIVNWCKQRADIKVVAAETVKGNLASNRVLEKNGFILYNATDNMLYWHKSWI